MKAFSHLTESDMALMEEESDDESDSASIISDADSDVETPTFSPIGERPDMVVPDNEEPEEELSQFDDDAYDSPIDVSD